MMYLAAEYGETTIAQDVHAITQYLDYQYRRHMRRLYSSAAYVFPTPMPPKSWRWFDVFRATQAFRSVCDFAQVRKFRRPQAPVVVVQVRRHKRKRFVQQLRAAT